MKIRLDYREIEHLLAPLAGVSDHPFRRICTEQGADLTYVEMISATALLYSSQKTLAMLEKHADEQTLGVQLTGKTAEETARAIAILDTFPFATIDINMGCPVNKVVKQGCGSAILRDPQRVAETVRLARQATQKPLSVKIRLGWDRPSINVMEVAEAVSTNGADWLTIHGRTRADDYSVAVDLEALRRVKARSLIPIIGNGNIFSAADAEQMQRLSGVDGVMVSRGALGNPWVFRELKTRNSELSLEEWEAVVLRHIEYQREAYGLKGRGAICMRKHLVWYMKGWPSAKHWRRSLSVLEDLDHAVQLVKEFVREMKALGHDHRFSQNTEHEVEGDRFVWDPKYEMDRSYDAAVANQDMV